MPKIGLDKVGRMSQREFVAIWARIATHEEALRSLHAGLDHGVRTLADGLELAFGKLAALDGRAGRPRPAGRGRKRRRA